ncbi:MAG: response regulator transcription factor [Myxococcota bacterium]
MDANVLLAEPNEILRKGLSCSLAQSRRVRRVVEAPDAARALAIAGRERVDIAIVGTDIIDETAANFIEKLESISTGVRCIVVVRDESRTAFDRAVTSRALGLLGPGSSTRELWEAIDATRTGRRYVSPALERGLIASLHMGETNSTKAVKTLTRRERTILQLIGEGDSNREIATRLGLSRRTVDTHRTRLMRKLQIHKTAGLVRLAVREGLVEA